jgi:hypothetical protein
LHLGLDRERLAKLLSMTGSGHDGEALTAIRQANRLLRENGKNWAEVLGTVHARAEAAPKPRETPPREAPSARPAPGARHTAGTSAAYQRALQYRDSFRREPIAPRLLGFPFWIVVELLAVLSPQMQLNTRGPVITFVFALGMVLGIAGWVGLGYLLLFSVA